MEVLQEKVMSCDEILVEAIFNLHYVKQTAGNFFEGETHDFWELLYVDKGCLAVQSGEQCHRLQQGDLIFHAPMQFHNVSVENEGAAHLIVICFSCASAALRRFANKIFSPTREEKELLVAVIREAQKVFYYGENDNYLTKLARKVDAPFGAAQVVRISLERLLIEMVRTDQTGRRHQTKSETSLRDTKARLELDAIIAYLEQNVEKRLSLDDICKEFFLSRSYLQMIFKKHTNVSIMDYYSKLRIEKAKILIRTHPKNFTEIADQLNYASIYHFSRKFKESTGMTPSEYAASVKDWI